MSLSRSRILVILAFTASFQVLAKGPEEEPAKPSSSTNVPKIRITQKLGADGKKIPSVQPSATVRESAEEWRRRMKIPPQQPPPQSGNDFFVLQQRQQQERDRQDDFRKQPEQEQQPQQQPPISPPQMGFGNSFRNGGGWSGGGMNQRVREPERLFKSVFANSARTLNMEKYTELGIPWEKMLKDEVNKYREEYPTLPADEKKAVQEEMLYWQETLSVRSMSCYDEKQEKLMQEIWEGGRSVMPLLAFNKGNGMYRAFEECFQDWVDRHLEEEMKKALAIPKVCTGTVGERLAMNKAVANLPANLKVQFERAALVLSRGMEGMIFPLSADPSFRANHVPESKQKLFDSEIKEGFPARFTAVVNHMIRKCMGVDDHVLHVNPGTTSRDLERQFRENASKMKTEELINNAHLIEDLKKEEQRERDKDGGRSINFGISTDPSRDSLKLEKPPKSDEPKKEIERPEARPKFESLP